MTTVELPSISPAPRRNAWSRALWIAIPLLVFGALLALGIIPRVKRNKMLARDAAQARQNVISVRVMQPQPAADTTTITLPGTLNSLHQTYVYGRANGYVRAWYTDIGAQVRQGQLMALIETPELDQQLQQARANLALARVSLQRLEEVSMPGAVTRQSLDDRKGAYEASLAAARQLEALTAYKRVRAPFSGVVTVRNIDLGSLINDGSAGGQPLFRLDRVDTLLLQVSVPQPSVTSIQPGMRVQVNLNAYPGKAFTGVVVRTAGALDATTRTLLTEIVLPNPDGLLYAGMYAQADLLLNRRERVWSLPDNVLYLGSAGPQVVVVDDQNRVHFRNVTLGRDSGVATEILSGLRGGERLVVNPNDDLTEGGQVRILNAPNSHPATHHSPTLTP